MFLPANVAHHVKLSYLTSAGDSWAKFYWVQDLETRPHVWGTISAQYLYTDFALLGNVADPFEIEVPNPKPETRNPNS